MKDIKIDKLYAAWMLSEILYERKLINKATIEAIRRLVMEERNKPKTAA